ncbi:MAG TPA: sensor histidine kinase, partial [Geminicoccus sp.]|uniref:sensor histidine kinase n=1 Tax=Geminicoccus sp. TaxID=2024832 RepID=UPI002C98FA0A
SQIELVPLEGRRLVLESTRDITERQRWMQRQNLLLDELTHRVKNTLTVVQSMARQTLRTSPDPEEFAERFEGRIAALAAAHKLLVESHWQGASLVALIEGQLQAYVDGNSARLTVTGEPITLPADLATPFGLVLHELATNAEKHGALSDDHGRVALSWRLTGNNRRHLVVTWQESDGPPVHRQERNGFGSVLIQKGIPGAKVRHEFLPGGVTCTIELEIPEAEPRDEDDWPEHMAGRSQGLHRGR